MGAISYFMMALCFLVQVTSGDNKVWEVLEKKNEQEDM